MLAPASVYAQQPRSSYTRNERENIKEKAKETLTDLQEFFRFVTDPTDPPSKEDIEDAVAGKFSGDGKIFFNPVFEVDNDTDPGNTTSGEKVLAIKQYLLSYRDRVKVAKDEAISISNISVMGNNIYAGNPYNYIRVQYTLKVKGTTVNGKPLLPSRSMIATMSIVDQKNKFQTLISGIYFANRELPENERIIPVNDRDADKQEETQTANLPPAYYQAKLAKGIRYTADDDFVHAYFALSEAKNSSAISSQVKTEFDKLNSRMRRKNYDNVEDLYTGLMAAAEKLGAKYRYDEATRYYRYAREVNPIKSKEVNAAINELRAKQTAEKTWLDLLERGSYDDARKGIESAIKKDALNVNMLVALGRVQAAVGSKTGAENFFDNALRLDAENPSIYLWQGRSLLQLQDFEGASNALTKYKMYAQEEAVPETDDYLHYAKGMMLVKGKEYAAAIDMLSKSNRPEATLEVVKIYLAPQTRNFKSAERLNSEILKKYPANADAHYLQGRLLILSSNAETISRNKDLAIKEYEEAISYNPNNFAWQYELAELQLGRGLYKDAIRTYTICLEKSPSAIAALHGRGRCYALDGRDNEAEDDFKTYLAKNPAPSPSFFVDYGRLLTRKGKYDDAGKMLQRAGDDKEALLASAVLNYVKSPADEQVYLNLFKRAFAKGVSRESVAADPHIKKLYESNREFRKLMREHKYATTI